MPDKPEVWYPSCGPPGCLWNADQRFSEAYLVEYPGYYKTADAGYIDADGLLFIMARTDDIINVAGHRLSTGGMEEVIAEHRDVAECAVIGIADEILVLNAGVKRTPAEIETEIVALVPDKIGPFASRPCSLHKAILQVKGSAPAGWCIRCEFEGSYLVISSYSNERLKRGCNKAR